MSQNLDTVACFSRHLPGYQEWQPRNVGSMFQPGKPCTVLYSTIWKDSILTSGAARHTWRVLRCDQENCAFPNCLHLHCVTSQSLSRLCLTLINQHHLCRYPGLRKAARTDESPLAPHRRSPSWNRIFACRMWMNVDQTRTIGPYVTWKVIQQYS